MKRFCCATGTIRFVHEALFSLNVTLVVMALVFQHSPHSLSSVLNELEFAINRYLHIRQTDFITGYWQFFIPGVALAVLFTSLLRTNSDSHFTEVIVRWVAGVAAVALAPAWLCATDIQVHGWTFAAAIQVCELSVVVCYVVFYLRGTHTVPWFWGVPIVVVHYAFWFWQFRLFFLTLVRGWGGAVAVAPVIGLCSGLAWLLYTAKLAPSSQGSNSRMLA